MAAVAALCAGLAGCKDKRSQAAVPPPKPSVDVVTLHAQPVALTTELPGRTSPYRTAEVRPQVYGIILKRLFTEGDTVQAGQQLYQIDPAPYEASLASAQATLLHAQASVKTAQSIVSRFRPLAAAFAVSRQDLDNAVGTLEQDQADVASAQAAIKTAAINLAYTKVLSPITGRTGRSCGDRGRAGDRRPNDVAGHDHAARPDLRGRHPAQHDHPAVETGSGQRADARPRATIRFRSGCCWKTAPSTISPARCSSAK